jgi:hypothetical protein
MVDDADFEWLNQQRWRAHKVYSNMYALSRKQKNKIRVTTLMHRLIISAKWGMEVDHKDNNGLNNQRENLRECTHSQNQKNCRKRDRAKSGLLYRGTRKHAKGNSYSSAINVNGVVKYLGSFPTETLAAKAYNGAAIKYHGEFGKLNVFVEGEV